MNCSTIQLQHRRKGQSGIQSSIKHLVQEWAAVLFDVPHTKNRPPAKNTSLCTGLQYNCEQFQHTRACMYVRLLQQLGKDLSHTPKEVSRMHAVSIHSNRTQHATWVSPLQRSPHRWWVLKSQLQQAKLLERGQNNKLTTHGCQWWSAGGASGGGGSLQPVTHRPRDGSQTKRGGSQTQGLLVTFIMNSMDC